VTDEEYAAAIEADWHRPPRPRTLPDVLAAYAHGFNEITRIIAAWANPDYWTDEQYAERMLREHKRATHELPARAITIRTNPDMPPDELARTVAGELRGQVLSPPFLRGPRGLTRRGR
jgi:hypothetical protein